jgi:hypothetical protein
MADLVFITNSSSKTVFITSNTALLASMTISGLTVSATAPFTNSLQIGDSATGADTFRLLRHLFIGVNGRLIITNSSVFVDGVSGGSVSNLGEIALHTGGALLATNGSTALTIGASTAGLLDVNGGNIQARVVNVGGNSRGTISLSGGTINAAASLTIGNGNSGTGAVWITDAPATFNAGSVTVGSIGIGTITVTNGRLQAVIINIGQARSGTITIAGGQVSTTGNLSLGIGAAATGTVSIVGGQLVVSNSTINVGTSGAGKLNLTGGQAVAANLIIGANASSNFFASAVNVDGGNLAVTGSATNQSLEIRRGALNLTTGLVTAARLIMTNSSGTITFSGGWLQSSASTISMGAPLIVGNGSGPATFELMGGATPSTTG